jgi:hypothetical protein
MVSMRDISQQVISHPPQIPSFEIRHGTRLRYVLNAAMIQQVITFQNLLDTLLFAASAIAGYDVFFAVKIRRVQVWATPVIGGATNVSVLFSGGTAGSIGDQKLHTDTSTGVQPAHVSARPALKSLASNYQESSSAIAFVLNAPSGAVVDLELSFVGTFDVAVAAQNALVGATIGATLIRGFDGLAAATSKATPVYPVAWI